MTDATSNAAVMARIEAEREQWDSLLNEIGEERMGQPTLSGDWTIKDVVAHLSAWREWSLARIEAVSRGEQLPSPPWPAGLQEVDEINVWIYEANRDRPLQDVLSESRGTFDRLRTVVQSLPEDELSDPSRFAWMDGEALGLSILSGSYFDHLHEEHEPELRAWLDSSA